MDPDETLRQASKRSRSANGKVKRRGSRAGEGEDEDGGEEEEEEENAARAWQQSRIFRVSRASGGKDRHSKVYTAKGLRDRRVRLSVSTAIQFYDLQDRLGYDQPSKAVEWLIKAAADAIAELPSLNGTFPNKTRLTPQRQQQSSPHNDSFYESGKEEVVVVVDRGGAERGGAELGANADPEPDLAAHRHLSANLTKSACSSTSETSKGSVLSLSRSESRVKARERARERAKEKVVVSTSSTVPLDQHTLNPNSHPGSSFIDLLMDVNMTQQHSGFSHKVHKQVVGGGGGGSRRAETAAGPLAFAPPAMDYLNAGVFSPGLFQASKIHNHNHPCQTQFSGSSPLIGIASFNHPSGFMGAVDHHPELQQFSFCQDHLIPVANDYSLNFSMSSLAAGYNRGTLQSNSSPLSHIQKFSSPITVDGGTTVPFFIPTSHAAAAAAAAENQFSGGLDGRLQLYYDGCRHSDLKEKGKN